MKVYALVAAIIAWYFGAKAWRQPRLAVIVATILWLAATVVFAWYVRNIANYNVMYGSIGAVIALLVWQYVLAVVALMGCEYNAVREKAMTKAVA